MARPRSVARTEGFGKVAREGMEARRAPKSAERGCAGRPSYYDAAIAAEEGGRMESEQVRVDCGPREVREAAPLGLSAADAAKLLGISGSHFHEMRKDGRLGPDAKRLGRCRRYDREELLSWWRAGCPSRDRWRAMRRGGVR